MIRSEKSKERSCRYGPKVCNLQSSNDTMEGDILSVVIYIFIHRSHLYMCHFITIATDLPDCSGGDRVRLICMGKGILMPDTRTLEDCLIPVFKTHPTPVNVSVRPEEHVLETGSSKKSGNDQNNRRTAQGGASGGGASNQDGAQVSQGCACVIL